jgi:hypothetical protein
LAVDEGLAAANKASAEAMHELINLMMLREYDSFTEAL